jgi:hypothetical protein
MIDVQILSNTSKVPVDRIAPEVERRRLVTIQLVGWRVSSQSRMIKLWPELLGG